MNQEILLAERLQGYSASTHPAEAGIGAVPAAGRLSPRLATLKAVMTIARRHETSSAVRDANKLELGAAAALARRSPGGLSWYPWCDGDVPQYRSSLITDQMGEVKTPALESTGVIAFSSRSVVGTQVIGVELVLVGSASRVTKRHSSDEVTVIRGSEPGAASFWRRAEELKELGSERMREATGGNSSIPCRHGSAKISSQQRKPAPAGRPTRRQGQSSPRIERQLCSVPRSGSDMLLQSESSGRKGGGDPHAPFTRSPARSERLTLL